MATRFARTHIVDINTIFTRYQLLNEELNLRGLPLSEDINTLSFLARRGLIKNNQDCELCNSPMKLLKKMSNIDGFVWTCKDCHVEKNCRNGSFFSKSHLKLGQILILMYLWAKEMGTYEVMSTELQLENDLKTIVDLCKYCYDICVQYLVDHPPIIGGIDDRTMEPKTVEVDCRFLRYFHGKYYPGGLPNAGQWVLGGIERGTGNCFLVPVPNRNIDTLRPLIERYIFPGTTIITDHRIIPQENVVDINNDGINTQNIKNMWLRVKRNLHDQYDISRALFPSHLQKFIWRNVFKDVNEFAALCVCIREQYTF